jgi:hypothetical protein
MQSCSRKQRGIVEVLLTFAQKLLNADHLLIISEPNSVLY